MGIPKGWLSLLFELKTTEILQGTVCQLGRQRCFVSEAQVHDIAKRFGTPITSSCSTPLKKAGEVDDVYLFRALGFDSVESIDASDFEQATHVLDFNKDIPDEFCERYDAIYDGGTLEHIFNFPQCLKNIYKMLKPGGIVMHGSPSNNFVDHGFYQFSPTLFYDYYSSNNWTILRSNLTVAEPDHTNTPLLIFKYDPGSIDHLSFGGWGKEMLGIWFVAKKTTSSTFERVPMQGSYVKAWSIKPENGNVPEIPPERTLALLKQIVRARKYSYKTARKLYRFFSSISIYASSLKKPKVIARY